MEQCSNDCNQMLGLKRVREENQLGKVKHELRVQIHELRIQIHELRVQIHELRV